ERLLWLRFMREVHQHTDKISPELLKIPAIEEAIALTEEAAYTPAELQAYETYWDAVSIEKSMKHDAFVAGEARGLQKGLAAGEARGLQKGLEEGKAEGIDLTLEAMQLLHSGDSVDEVHAKTGIDKGVLKELRDSFIQQGIIVE
ncbi:MAG: hypothetical protein ACX932_01715, partial [Gammaproteobacteria bacterium]